MNTYHLTRRFSLIYGAAAVWGTAGGGLLTLSAGQIIFGSLLIGAAVVLLFLVATGRIIKEREYTGTDIFFLFLPLAGVFLIGGVYFFVFPSSYLVLGYLGVILVLGILAGMEARRSSAQQGSQVE